MNTYPVAVTRHADPHVASAPAGIAALIGCAFAGSTLLTPLYPLYKEAFGFSQLTLTLIYAVYVIGNVTALLLFGRLSDQIGRRWVALAGLVLALASAVMFLFAHDTAWLFGARILNGFAVGCTSGTATAWLADLLGPDRRARASIIAVAANFIGIALGPLLAGLLVQYAPSPLRTPYLAYIALLAVIIVITACTRETVKPHPLREVSLRPRIGVPRELLRKFIAPAVTAFAVFGLVGYYAALVPSLVLDVLGESNRAIGAAIVAELFAAAAIAVFVTAKLSSRISMRLGLALLIPSAGLLVLARAVGSMPILLITSALAGIACALGYRGSLQLVTELAPTERRAEVVSSYYVVCFAGNSVPVIGVGLLGLAVGSLAAMAIFGAAIAAFAVAALLLF